MWDLLKLPMKIKKNFTNTNFFTVKMTINFTIKKI